MILLGGTLLSGCGLIVLDPAGEVARRLVIAMETVREVLAE